jgi:hypothetical protein
LVYHTTYVVKLMSPQCLGVGNIPSKEYSVTIKCSN